jgi:signal transduction histidine kinase
MREEGEFLVVDVRDNGAGIEPEDREKIFDPFFSTKESGTGLGLAIASKVIQAHGGYIKVWREAGRGSIFSLYFPAAGEAR